MGQKVHPYGMRLGIIKPWLSTWYAETKDFSNNINNDLKIRNFLNTTLKKAYISKIIIERFLRNVFVTIYTARPGVIIGRKGEDIDKLRQNIINISNIPIQINIVEVKRPELDSKLIADSIASQLERRVMFRRAIKKAVQNAIRFGVKGIKIEVSGRLGGAEIARTEWHREGRVPLHTLRADIDFSISNAYTTYGIIGVKVWVFKGEILDIIFPVNQFNTELTIKYKKH